ncbi:NAD(P)-binding protein [Punctularia strigosozonata HHB-11173 SS5]|uniref:NAD(P)-binding protein n=1 Tax=Punctularia strigosozonata (strain HHB-11173) TaxID=741275 RepID=UPI00044162E5|nr:NAD(P)-binding protein [Punctularia strigosozonata HHB-11173 SS5]EIN08062.1 NAD(P)-binding protein [Punctularia strigosozonata HHB-11173 SS5]
MGLFFSKGYDPVRDLGDLTGKVVVVTGGNTGIGLPTVKFLARAGAKVYLAARNEAKATAAIEGLKKEGLGSKGGEVIWLKLDLTDPTLTKAAAEELLAKEKRLDILINNAALTIHPYVQTKAGYQEIIMANLIGPVIFTQYLLPLLESTAQEPGADVRIVQLSSDGHRMVSNCKYAPEDFNDEFKSSFMPQMARYGYSKIAFLHYTAELQKRLTAKGIPIICLSVHPGMVETPNGIKHWSKWHLAWVPKVFGASPDKGCHNSLFAATAPVVRAEAEKYKNSYLTPVGKLVEPSNEARKEDARIQVWNSLQTVCKDLGVPLPDV